MPGQQPEDQIPGVSPQVEPSAELTPNVPLATPVGGAIDEAASVEQRMAYWKAHATAVDAQTQFQALDNEKLYNPKTGLLSQNLGKDAGPAVEQTLNDYKAKQSDIAAQLGPMAKAQFMRSSNEHMNTVQRQGYVYERNQYNKWDGENVTASVKMAQESALNTYDIPHDPAQGDPLQHQVDKQVALIQDYGQRSGIPQPMVDLEVSKAKSATYAAVGEDMISKNNLDGARQLLQDHGADIEHGARYNLQNAVKSQDTDNQALGLANRILAPDLENGVQIDRATALSRMDDVPELANNAKLHDMVENRIEKHFAVQRQATMAQQSNVMDTIQKALADDPNADIRKAAGPMGWQTLDGEQRLAAERLSASMVRKDGPPVNSPRYFELSALVGRPEFGSVDLNKEVDRVSPTQLTWLNEQQVKQNDPSGKGKTDPKFVAQLSENDIVNGKLRPLGLDPRENSYTTTEQSQQIYNFKKNFAIQKEAAMAANGGKPLNSEQLDGIATKLVANFAGDGKSTPAPLFNQPLDVVSQEFNRGAPQKPAPTLTSTVSKEDMQGWKTILADPKASNYASSVAKLARWKQGLNPDGTPNPVLRQRYEAIRAELDATKPAAPPLVPPTNKNDF